MLVFIDESGDSGLGQASSEFFTIALVIFEDHGTAQSCDNAIEELKKKLSWSGNKEFHFKQNADRTRRLFLETVNKFDFYFYAIVINKRHTSLSRQRYKSLNDFYHYASGLVFDNAKEKLDNATIVFDKSWSEDFRRQLAQYLRGRMNSEGRRLIKKIKMQDSHRNNLLQLADYICGVISRSVEEKKKFATEYRALIKKQEKSVEISPR